MSYLEFFCFFTKYAFCGIIHKRNNVLGETYEKQNWNKSSKYTK